MRCLIQRLKNIFSKKINPKEPVYQILSDIEWDTCPSGLSSWNKHAGLKPQKVIIGRQPCIRLACRKSNRNEDGWETAAIKSAQAYGDGRFECYAKFKSGKSTWPAIWLIHPKGGDNNYATYYEIDLSEYYETRDNTDTSYHCPQSMRGGEKYVRSVTTPIKKDDWNKFACTWDNEAIRVWINDNLVLEILNDGNPDHFPVDESARTFQIVLSMQYTNRWLSVPDLNELPLWMDIKDAKISKRIK